jgi:biopolymer transport protein TolQ
MTHLFSATALLYQDATQAVPPSTLNHGNELMDMLHNAGWVAWAVLIVLLIGSLFSWAIIFGKWGSFRRARAQSKRFLRAFRKATRLQEIATVSEQFKPSPLVNVFDEVYETYRRQTGGYGPPKNITALERAAQTASSESLTMLENRLTWLASIGAIAPFVGLFGTVMGIVTAFVGLGTEGTATLRAVAPGVAEALITTAAGLLVAIPAVIAYNQFTASCRDFAARMDDFARELLNSMEEAALEAHQDPGEREKARGVHH